ncbi:MAG TPA: hypothetical protein VGX48_09420 [Pyrinomonadaceae bacterium]|jgi:F0F1-type ATP synthase membrane subunit c/vacuolar-type H+-ATPase subunit K|nr:hypothetical protein [Pyrinomonadaceae bacterium]
MMNRPGGGHGPEARLRTMRILWAAFLMNVGLFVAVTHFGSADVGERAGRAGGVPPLLYALAAVGLASVVASFFAKGVFYRRAAERREPALVQTGFILALALSEVAALLGVVGVFITLSDYAYALFALGALGILLHFPSREQVSAPYYKSTV